VHIDNRQPVTLLSTSTRTEHPGRKKKSLEKHKCTVSPFQNQEKVYPISIRKETEDEGRN